jgi:hypothetical protein
VIAAALVGDHRKLAARVGRGGAGAAEMDEGGEILPLACTRLHIARASENIGDIAIQIDRCQLDGVARDRANIEKGRAAAGLRDCVAANAEPRGVGMAASSIWKRPTALEAGR